MNNRALTSLRYVGNTLVIVGYFVLLYVDMIWGLAVCLSANVLLFPWAIKGKYWDVVVIAAFFSVLNGSKLIIELQQYSIS